MKYTVIVAALLVWASTASAAPRPKLAPDRDVTVTYDIRPAGNPAREVEVAIQAGGARLHITSPELPTAFLVDRQAETAAILLPVLRAYTVVSIAGVDAERTVLHGADFVRGGHQRIAGLDCTVWHAHSDKGEAEGCITPDGVILSGRAISDRKGELGAISATRVVYGRLPPDLFVLPPDYQESPIKLNAKGLMQ
jgi:hypothetical protein